VDDEIALLEVLEPLRAFLGTWRGEGAGSYPTIESFRYREEVQFWHVGKPFLGYQQRTRNASSGVPMHSESGFWRATGPSAGTSAAPGTVDLEVVIAHPTGLAEVLLGTAAEGRIQVASTTITRTPSAKEVTAVTRTLAVDGDELTYEVQMAAVGQPLQHHLAATLRRVT
jgi:hypothetical protein